MNKKLVIAILVLIIGGLLFYFFHGNKSQDITNYPSSGKTIVAFGDSLIFGLGSTKGNDLVSLLSNMIDEPIINFGRSGDTTSDGLERIDSVLSYDPKIVIVLLGGNDYLRRIPKETTFKNLEEIIKKIQDEGAVVVLLGVQGGVIGDPYKKEFNDLAEKMHTAYVSNVLEGIIGHRNLMADQIHPNDAGYQLIAEKVFPVLQSVLK